MLLMMMMLSSLLPMMMLSASCAQLSHSAEVDSPMLASLAEHVLFESRFFIVRNTQGSEGPGRGRHALKSSDSLRELLGPNGNGK